MLNKEEYINSVIEFYGKDNIPNSVQDALNNEKPAYFTYKSCKKHFNMSLAELLKEIHDRVGYTRVKAPRKLIPIEEQLEATGFSLLKRSRENGRTYLTLKCDNCDGESRVENSQLNKWYKYGIKHCSTCRETIKCSKEGKEARIIKLLSGIYSNFVEFDSLLKGTGKYGLSSVKFKCCGNTKEYNNSTLAQMTKEGQALSCDYCKYPTSAMESWVEELIPLPLDSQVPYYSLGDCDRNWLADFVYEGSIIEVTSGLSNKREYSENMQQKIDWCTHNNIPIYIITSLHQVKDIVRALSKGKESDLQGDHSQQ